MNDGTVHIGSFATALDAHFALGLIEQRGIPCFIVGEATATTWGMSLGSAEGIRLLVREEDVDAANEVLAEIARHGTAPGAESEDPGPDEPPDAG